jgi:uncharacterized integral membrane protein
VSGVVAGGAEWTIVRDKSKSQADPESPRERKGNVRLVGLGLAAVLLVWYAVANLGTVSIKFWISERRAPLILVIVIAGLLGALIMSLAQRHKSRRS